MQKHNASKMLGNPVACNDSNPEFLLSFAACLDRTMIDLPKVLTYETNIARTRNYTKSYVLFTTRVT